MQKRDEQILLAAYKEYWGHSTDFVFVKDLQGVYRYASQAFAEMTGCSAPSEVVGKTDFTLFASRDLAARYTEDDARLLENGVSLENYIEPITPIDGHPRYVVTSKYILRDESGIPIGICGTGRDITPTYIAQKTYENQLRTLFELPPGALATALFDITSWRVVDVLQRQDDSAHLVSHYSRIDEYFSNVQTCIVEDTEARSFFAGLSKARLQEDYGQGIHHRSLEYLRRMTDGSERFVRDDLHLLLDPVNGNLSLIIVLRDIDKEKRAYACLLDAAERDTMTGLLNRNATVRFISDRIAASQDTHALFMIDLDNFKAMNDTFGHQHGDKILSDVANAIRNTFAQSDIIGRLGGDEFMVLTDKHVTEEEVRHKADELLAALQFSCNAEGVTIELTTSIGITVFSAENADFNNLYSEADTALYHAKRNGKNSYTLYNHNAHALENTALLQNISNVNTVQLRTLLEYMDGGVVLAEISDDIHITYISPSLYRTFEHDLSRPTLRDDIFSVILPEDLPGLRAAVFEAARSNNLLEYSYRIISKNKVAWCRLRAKRIPETGDGVHRLVAVITDISDLRHANKHLLDAEERYRTAVEQTNALLWEIDLSAKTITLSGPAWKNLGFDVTVYPDAPDGFLNSGILHPSAAEAFRAMFADIYAGKTEGSCYFKLHDAQANELWVKNQYKLLYDENGTPCSALCVMQPVPNIHAEMQRFEQESHFAEFVSSDLHGCLRINLTQDILEYITIGGDARFSALCGTSYNAATEKKLHTFISADDLPAFQAAVSKETLLANFLVGETRQFVSYRRIGDTGATSYIGCFISLMRHPISGDVYAFCYLRNNKVQLFCESALDIALLRDDDTLLYSPNTLRAIASRMFSAYPPESRIALTIIEITGLDKAHEKNVGVKTGDLTFTFARLCWTIINGDAVLGQLSENRIVVLRANADNSHVHRKRIADTLSRLKALVAAHADVHLNPVAGYAISLAASASYEALLKKATLACRSAAETLGESTVGYVETGIELFGNETEGELAEKYHMLEALYQQQLNLLRISENDELTGLLGKHAFYRRLRECLDAEPPEELAIVRFDINRFKIYNDVYGTTAGDRLLRRIAARIRQSDIHIYLSARFESDHFVLLTANDTRGIARFKDDLIAYFASHAPDFRLSFTFGVYQILRNDVETSLMCDRALLALRTAKGSFDTRLSYYDNTLRTRLLDEQQLVSDMADALKNEQFVVYFQPLINYESGSIIGAEALVRWEHPQRGFLHPGAFVPLFEQNGLITRLDEYVWDRCCRFLRDWYDRYPQTAAFSLSVNVSRLDIYNIKLCETLKLILEKYNLHPSSLRLEITESAYMENPQQLIETVKTLRQNGFLVEMDDFGSGYSSLNTLKDVTFDILKLDMKFLANCEDSARGGNIISSVIRMAHWLKLPIIAEGIVSKEQADYLKSLGCIYMQGCYFENPLPAESFEQLLVRNTIDRPDKYRDTNVSGMAAFWDSSVQTALLFNSFVGGAAIMEYHDGLLEALRVNDSYYKTLGTTREQYMPMQTNILTHMDDTNHSLFIKEVEHAIATGEECACELQWMPDGGVTHPWTRTRIRLLAKNYESAIIYVAIEDITARKQLEIEQEVETERNRLLMQTTGTGFFDYDYSEDVLQYQLYHPHEGIIKRVVENCRESAFTGRMIHPDASVMLLKVIKQASTAHTEGELTFLANFWGKGMRWSRLRYASIENKEGRVYRLVGQCDDVHEQKQRNTISDSIQQRLNMQTPPTAYNDTVAEQIFRLFYASSDISASIETTLALLGEYYNLSRVYIYEDKDKHIAAVNTFEWCAASIAPIREGLSPLPYDNIGGWDYYTHLFDATDTYFCADSANAPESFRGFLQTQSIHSFLQCALKDRGVFAGMIGFDECRPNCVWSEEQIGTLVFVSRIISAFLLHLRQSDSITESKQSALELMTERQKNALILSASKLELWTYDMQADTITTTVSNPPYYDAAEAIAGSYHTVIERGYVMPESIEDYIALHEKMKGGAKTATAVIRFVAAVVPTEWMRITYTAVDTESASIAIAIGQPCTAPLETEGDAQ